MYLKKYLTEGLIQVAILLSLSGVRVDVGVEPGLPPHLHEMMLGPSAGITQTRFHNLWNRLEDGHASHPKNVDLDGFFTSRRLLGLVRSLDRLQVPNTELETWLVHREPDTLPWEHRGQPAPLESTPVRLEEDRAGPALHPGDIPGNQEEEAGDEAGDDVDMEGGALAGSPQPLSERSQGPAWSHRSRQEETHRQVLSDHPMYSDSLDEEEGETGDGVEEEQEEQEEEEEEEGELARTSGRERRASVRDRESAQHDEDQESLSLQECLRLLEHTFPFTNQPSEEILPTIGGSVDHEHLSAESTPPLSPLIPSEHTPLDLELQWQDLLAIMEPHALDIGTPFPSNQDIDGLSGAIQNPLDAAILTNYTSSSNSSNDNQMIYQDVHLMEAALPLGTMSLHHPETHLLPLTPSTELDQQDGRLNTSGALDNMDINGSLSTSYHGNLLSRDPSGDLNMGLDVENGYTTFDMNPLTEDPTDNFITDDTNTGSMCTLSPRDPTSFDMNFYQDDFNSVSLTPHFELSGVSPNLPIIPPSHSLVDDEEESDYSLPESDYGLPESDYGLSESDYGLPGPLEDLLEDATILDEMSLLDLALEEGFSPEMAARLEEEGYLVPEQAVRNVDPHDTNVPNTEEDDDGTSWSTMAQDNSRILHQESQEKADSDSGLSLDCSFSPASPCGSESSCYSSSSTSSSSSSGSSEGSLYSEGNGQKDEEGGVNLDMELEVTIKQEEEEGAVGGYYSSDVNKIVPSSYQEGKLFNGLPWQEHIGHDHTYNQAWPGPTSVTGKTSKKQSKYSSGKSRTKPYSRSSSERFAEVELWSRDDRRARSLKIPFSNELIVNLPVDDFNELLANHHLSEQQLNLVRDIRRRGKNKMAAQNCRRRKLGALLGLEVDVSGLRRRRAWLRREKQEALKSLQEMERRLEGLYQEVMLGLRDEEGRPLDASDYALQFGANGSVTVTPRRQGTLPRADGKAGKKYRDKKCDESK